MKGGWRFRTGTGSGSPNSVASRSASSAPGRWAAVETSSSVRATASTLAPGLLPDRSEQQRRVAVVDSPELRVLEGNGRLADAVEVDAPDVRHRIRCDVAREATEPAPAGGDLDDGARKSVAAFAGDVYQPVARLDHRQHRPARVAQRRVAALLAPLMVEDRPRHRRGTVR